MYRGLLGYLWLATGEVVGIALVLYGPQCARRAVPTLVLSAFFSVLVGAWSWMHHPPDPGWPWVAISVLAAFVGGGGGVALSMLLWPGNDAQPPRRWRRAAATGDAELSRRASGARRNR